MADAHHTIRALFSKALFDVTRLTHHGIQLLVDLGLVNPTAHKITCMGVRTRTKTSDDKHCCNPINEKMLPGAIINLYAIASDRTISDDELHGHTMTFVKHLFCSHHSNECNARRVADHFLPVYLQYREQHPINTPQPQPVQPPMAVHDNTVADPVTAAQPDAVALTHRLLHKNETLEWELQQTLTTVHGQQTTIGEQQNTIGAQQHTISAQQEIIGEQQRTISEQRGNISAQQEEIKKQLRRLRQLRFNSSF
ncbi:hypothetical protein LTR36_008733 [Oleoguttula mirabilis]|uniref:Uncharacterized protein n=1 Tax=Oleoguttula mirabilis TaxID=1507867 RepID=A0AAV9JTS9_9PEZI|nr:hypothetical protein LTR36_008733 [Oleoguttula mirabilis]